MRLDPEKKLLDVLREDLGLTGAKPACRTGHCGACKVIVNGAIVNSCLMPVAKIEGKSVLTIEGLSSGGDLHPVQRAFVASGAIQCGYCTPGMIMQAKALLDKNPDPTEKDVRKALSGNLCRCTGYKKPVEAVLLAASWMKRDELNGQ
jgi:carbon-monoxide dehydrogenase small subunit